MDWPGVGDSVIVRATLKTGATYFAAAFAVGFVLGTVRVLLLLPVVGETAAVLLEIPIILFASWIAARWSSTRFDVPAEMPPRVVMGAVGFAFLMLAELLVSSLIFGRSLEDTVTNYQSLPGVLGLSAQVIFALLPVFQARLLRRGASSIRLRSARRCGRGRAAWTLRSDRRSTSQSG